MDRELTTYDILVLLGVDGYTLKIKKEMKELKKIKLTKEIIENALNNDLKIIEDHNNHPRVREYLAGKSILDEVEEIENSPEWQELANIYHFIDNKYDFKEISTCLGTDICKRVEGFANQKVIFEKEHLEKIKEIKNDRYPEISTLKNLAEKIENNKYNGLYCKFYKHLELGYFVNQQKDIYHINARKMAVDKLKEYLKNNPEFLNNLDNKKKRR